jgi:hypothetical protein
VGVKGGFTFLHLKEGLIYETNSFVQKPPSGARIAKLSCDRFKSS